MACTLLISATFRVVLNQCAAVIPPVPNKATVAGRLVFRAGGLVGVPRDWCMPHDLTVVFIVLESWGRRE